MFFGVPILMHIIIRLSCALIFGTPKINNFAFEKNGKLIIFMCPNT